MALVIMRALHDGAAAGGYGVAAFTVDNVGPLSLEETTARYTSDVRAVA